jgi:hypothetical protein
MNERGFDRIAKDYLSDGPTVLADRVFDAAFREVHQTRQRRVLRRTRWRFPTMNTFAKAAVGAVAIISVAYVGLSVLGPDTGNVGGVASPAPSATVAPTPTPAPTPTATPTPLPSAPPLTQQFTSEHGFSISYPETWSTRPATGPWTSGYVDFGQPGADLIYDSELEASLFLALASQPLGDQTPAEWEADIWAIISEDEPASDCAAEADPVTVDGSAGVRCDNLVLVTEGGRGYWLMLYTSGDEPWVGEVYDAAWFTTVLDTIDLQPEQATE